MTGLRVAHSALLCVMLVSTALHRAGADEVALVPVLDNSLIEDPSGAKSSGSGPAIFVGRNSGGSLRRGILAFDVAASVPVGSSVQSVTLTLVASNASDSTQRTISLHRVLSGWGEGASSSSGGSGAPSEQGDATWIHRFYPDSLWNHAGGDFVAGASGATNVKDVGVYSWSGEGLVADVQLWLDNPAVDFGWLLLGDETENSTAKRFDSRESQDPGTRPALAIRFTPPDATVRSLTWGRVKALFHPEGEILDVDRRHGGTSSTRHDPGSVSRQSLGLQ